MCHCGSRATRNGTFTVIGPAGAAVQKKLRGGAELLASTVGHAESMNTAADPQARGRRSLRRADGGAIRVLVVDDEPTLAEVLASVLRYEGWDVRTAGDGSTAVRTAKDFQPDAVILDIMLPDFDGLEVLRRMRAFSPKICVLFLTARDAVEDRIAGITAGGDDYVTKPFSLEEVLARLRGLLRRADVARTESDSELVVGDLTMDEDAREVRRGGELIELTATEFELLRYLMRNPRRVLSKAQILDRVWNYDFGGQAHVVELYISYLRKKIDAGREPLIQTVRGVGYVLKPASG
jgi:two-component system, OmpR family, response regulator